ncbi:hypothetical protein A1O3_07905 [Capronia epimyces CBS 606.96]|uniref:NB-ARC domain-containing protein n=1 Tax=Capronia epimyces CBS 606.96 TaxID=1182542 RepID=W9XRK5_9EURO|nr:uncharacterized protein A1O3_07905 [Capronia epimyces CBS 606.96]EXJ79626.1 hypothetical protein A1O3_07905 [Capronia epimyces CBS 606.96]
MWPRDLLASAIANSRLVSFGWDARTHSRDVLATTSLSQQGNNLLQELSIYRRSTQTIRRPIIFVPHSLGGLILKSGLVNANLAAADHNPHLRDILTCTYGIIFMGTPHQGSAAVRRGGFLLSLSSIYFNTNQRFLKHLEAKSEWLENNMVQFTNISNKFQTIFCYEAFPVEKAGSKIHVVTYDSAVVSGQRGVETRQIMKNHITMTKFDDEHDNDYQAVLQMLKEMVQAAATWTGREEDLCYNERHRAAAGAGILPAADLGSEKFHVSFDSVPANNKCFTGRRNDLERLRALFLPRTNTGQQVIVEDDGHSETETKTVVLQGMGGVGKTQIAREFAHSYRARFTSIFWLDAHNRETLLSSFVQLAEQLIQHYESLLYRHVRPEQARVQAVAQLNLVGYINEMGEVLPNRSEKIVQPVKKWFQAQGNGQWLLIYDNYDNLHWYSIGDFLPNSQHGGSVLITSRRDDCYRLCGAENFINVELMEPSDGVELLLKCYGVADSSRSSPEYEGAPLIVKELGRLPLAIDLAGTYLRNRRSPLKSYLKMRGRMRKALNFQPSVGEQNSYQHTVYTTWEVSFDEIKKENPDSADFLLLWGFLSNEKIQVEMLQRGMGLEEDEEVRDRIAPLLSFSLVSKTGTRGEDAFTVHPLVHEWARIRLPDQKHRFSAEALSLVASSVSPSEIWTTGFRKSEHWAFERQIMAHIEATSQHVREAWNDKTFYQHAEYWIKYAHVYFYHGRYGKAEEIYLGVVGAYRSHLCPSNPELLRAIRGLATVNRFQSKYGAAKSLYEEAMDGFTKQLGPDDIETLQTIQSLAVVYRHLGRLKDSMDLYEWALHGRNRDDEGFYRKSGPDHHYTIHTVLGLAIVLQHRGLYAQAVKRYNEVVDHRVRQLGPGHPDTLVAKQNLADGLGRSGEYAKAMQLFHEVLHLRINQLGSQHPDTLRTIDSIGILYRDQKEWAKAQDAFNKAYKGRKEQLGDLHPDTLATVQNIAINYRKQSTNYPYDTEQYSSYLREAEIYYKKAHAGRRQKLGDDHTDTMKSWEGLALVSEARGDYKTARDIYIDVKNGFKKNLVPESEDVKRALEALIRLSEHLEDVEDEVKELGEELTQAKISNQGGVRKFSTTTFGV